MLKIMVGNMCAFRDFYGMFERYNWNALRTCEGDARNVPFRLIALLFATNDDDAEYWFRQLDNVIVVQGKVYEAALPCTRIMMYALANFSLSRISCYYICELIWLITMYYNPKESGMGNYFKLLTFHCGETVRRNLAAIQQSHILNHPDARELVEIITAKVRID